MEQLNLFDYQGKQRPCDYGWNRYIGQRVKILETTGIIVDFGPYYTHIKTADGFLVGTPTTCSPIKEKNDEANVNL